MKTYPDVITAAELARLAHITDAEIATDIAETEQEIAVLARVAVAENEIADAHPLETERRIAALKASARPAQIAEHQAFVDYLRRLQAARVAELTHHGARPGAPSPDLRMLPYLAHKVGCAVGFTEWREADAVLCNCGLAAVRGVSPDAQPTDLRAALEKALPAVRVAIAACGLGHIEGRADYWEAVEAEIEAALAGSPAGDPEPAP